MVQMPLNPGRVYPDHLSTSKYAAGLVFSMDACFRSTSAAHAHGMLAAGIRAFRQEKH